MTPEEQRAAILEALREAQKDEKRDQHKTLLMGCGLIVFVPMLFVFGWILVRGLAGG